MPINAMLFEGSASLPSTGMVVASAITSLSWSPAATGDPELPRRASDLVLMDIRSTERWRTIEAASVIRSPPSCAPVVFLTAYAGTER